MKKMFLSVLCAVCIAALNFNIITVSASLDDTTLVELDYITSAKAGNIFAITDTISFRQIITNKVSESVVSNYYWNITDETGTSVATYSGSDELGAGAEKTRRITLDNPGKYGIYTINVTEENYRKASPGTKYTVQYTEEFSVCISLTSSNVDEHFGFNQSLVRGLGDSSSISLIHNVGAKWNRESIMWIGIESSSTKGSYNISNSTISRVDAEIAGGINMIGVLTGRHPLYCNGGTENPNTPEDIAAFAAMCGYVAETFEGRIETFEIWNEWNSSNFNPTMESPETYAEVLKASYAAIKAANPNATVIGCDVAGIDTAQIAWIRRVLTALNGEKAMDAISVHCYDFSATEGFPEMQFVNEATNLKNLLAEFNLDIPIWLTETGINTYDNSTHGFVSGTTKNVQLNSMVMMNTVNKAYGLFDYVLQYCLYDNSNKSLISANWGVLNCWQRGYTEEPEAKLVPHGAKPAYLGLAAMNYFIGGNATFVDKKKNDRCYAFEFHNNNLNKDVLVAINGGIVNTVTQDFDLGCQNIDIYDKYGNLKKQLNSATGVYSIETYTDPIYIVGEFGNLEEINSDIRIRAAVDVNTNVVTISGNVPDPGDFVSIMVVTKGAELTAYDSSRVKFLTQATADGDGNFSASYTADSLQGEYQIYVNTKARRSKVIKDLVLSYSLPGLTVTKNEQAVTAMSQLSAGDRPVITLSGLDISQDSWAQLIVAQYSGDELINVSFTDTVGSFTTLGSEFMKDFTVVNGADSIKVMYWYMDTLVPILEHYEIN
ncbi:MAG: hypothetical protein J5590_08785 [Clostridia bacterium]|nr:hypothetical protein [Clostridia bacterium]